MWVALATMTAMVFFSLAHHLGLVEKAYDVCGEIASCPICTTFWGTLLILLLCGCHLLIAVVLALVSAYLSVWMGLLYDRINHHYTRLWRRRRK